MKDIEPTFTKGSRYRIMSRGSKNDFLITLGEFRGYNSFGNDNAITIKMESEGDQETVRIIPLTAILAIDVIESKEPEEEDSEATRVYFG